MEIRVPYGHSFLTAEVPNGIGVDLIEPAGFPAAQDPLGCTRAALSSLVGGLDWKVVAKAKSVAIAVNDKTRPVPHHQLLPPLLERLSSLGIQNAAITFHVALGTHPVMGSDELPGILPKEILQRYRVVMHDSKNNDLLIYLGKTTRGTPVWSNKAYVQSDLKIAIGNIEPHQFVGFSGGVKSAAIGLAGEITINHNHALMAHPDSQLGEYETNPARQDVEEIGKMIGINLALNAILNRDKQIVNVLAGDPRAVMQAGIPLSRQVCQVRVSAEYGLMISSPGGYPKDINLYQSQKGLAHAALVTRPGGTIILVAACPEGTGSQHYEDWMADKHSYAEIFERFSAEGFRIGPHKAYQIARDATKTRLMFCSDMDPDLSRALLLNPVKDLQTAINTCLVDLKPGEHIGVMAHSSSTIPYLQDGSSIHPKIQEQFGF